MSFILDALKKSENERQRTIGPSLADVQFRRARTERPWWAMAIGVLLIVNIGVLAFVLTRKPAPVAPAPTPSAAPASIAAAPPATASAKPNDGAAPSAFNNPEVRSLAEEADPGYPAYEDEIGATLEGYPAEAADLAAAASVPDGPPIVQRVDEAQSSLSQRAEYAGAQASSEMLPTLNSVVAGGAQLPDLRLDIHVYSNTPADRFVFINMRKYTEGQSVTEGPLLERVTPDGAILSHQGTRFLLPRQ
jgi:general secretion pathway protein B